MTEILKRECILSPVDCSSLKDSAPDVFAAVMSSGICGKGYSGLPVAPRWETFAGKEGEKEIICLISGDCADTLMQENAEAVWTGAALTAKAFGLEKLWVACDREREIPESVLDVSFRPYYFRHSLSAGEETLIFAGMEGALPITRPQPPYPAEKGLFGHPTLIHSAEFFAHIPYLLLGQDRDTKLCKISGAVKNPGICEVFSGTPVREIISGTGNDAEGVKAVQFGGANGAFLAEDELSFPFGYEQFREKGVFFGDGSVRVLRDDSCPAGEVYRCLAEAYRCSCGRCVFCREGLYQLYLLAEDLVHGKANDGDLALMRDISGVIMENAACDYGKMTAAAVNRALHTFADEIEAHTRQKCRALACPGMFTVHILPDKCTGCGKCAEVCPVSAVEGGAGLIHVVDQAVCTQCGKCMPCEADAIVRAGMQKPAGPEHPIPVGTFVQKKKGLQRRPR